MKTIDDLCHAVGLWSMQNFGQDDACWRVFGIMEEIGAEMLTRRYEEGSDIPEVYDDLADIIIFSCDAAYRWGFEMSECIEAAQGGRGVPNKVGVTGLAVNLMKEVGTLAYTCLKEHQGIREGRDANLIKLRRCRALGSIWLHVDAFCLDSYGATAHEVASTVFDKIVSKRNWSDNGEQKSA